MNAPKWNLIYDKTFDDSAHSHDFFFLVKTSFIYEWVELGLEGVLYQKR